MAVRPGLGLVQGARQVPRTSRAKGTGDGGRIFCGGRYAA